VYETQEEALTAQLQRQSDLADAKLGVAEDLGWFAAFGWGSAAYLYFDSWLGAFAVGAVYYWFGTRPYKKAADKATKDFQDRLVLPDED
jgi:hypothetical protein